eukprot:3306897-Rhodomonas_salina.1
MQSEHPFTEPAHVLTEATCVTRKSRATIANVMNLAAHDTMSGPDKGQRGKVRWESVQTRQMPPRSPAAVNRVSIPGNRTKVPRNSASAPRTGMKDAGKEANASTFTTNSGRAITPSTSI